MNFADLIKDIAIIGVILYFATLVFLYVMQRQLTYFPDTSVPQPAMFAVPEAEIVSVKTDDGLELRGWYVPPSDDEKPVILMYHGNAGHIGIRAFKMRPYIDAGYGFLMAEYRGYGGNKGTPNEENLYLDGRSYFKYLTDQQALSNDRIVLYGESLGTGVAVQMATEFKGVAAVMLEAPYTSLPDVGQNYYFLLPVKLLMKDKFDSLSKIKGIDAPLIILHGEKDMVVPYRFGKRLYEVADEPKQMESFRHGGHNNLYTVGFQKKALAFLDGLSK